MNATPTLAQVDPPRPPSPELYASDRSVRRLVGWLAHHLNGQLTAALGHVQLLEWKGPKEALRSEDLRELRAVVEESWATVDRLLAMTAQQIVRPRPVDARQELESWTGGRQIEATLPPDGLVLEVDPEQLDEMLTVLFDHCREAAPDRIRLRARKVEPGKDPVGPATGSWLLVELLHDGRKLRAAEVDHLLRPLERRDYYTADLSMAAVAGMARQNGGIFDIPVHLEGEARLHLYLPLTT